MMNTNSQIEEYISQKTDRVQEVKELVDENKISYTQQNQLTANAKKYLDTLIESLKNDDNTNSQIEEYVLRVGALGTYKQGDKVPFDVIGKENIEKYKKMGIIE